MLTGGGDVDPSLFGEAAHPATYEVDRQRDEMEIALARWALRDDKPLFAICRGIQVMNVALGGSLVQDLPTQWPNALPHSGSQHGLPRHEAAHSVTIEPDTRLARILGATRVPVNSFHHQAINRLAEGLRIVARADDGVIEAVEAPHRRYYLGVQWHPEDMAPERADMMRLFREFVAACHA
jgi:putative glutamine amidotransferase